MKMHCRFRILAVFLFCLAVVFPVQALAYPATMARSEFVIGGIPLYSSFEYVQQIYGTPSNVKTKPYHGENYWCLYDYNGLFGVFGITKNSEDPSEDGVVWGVTCKESNLTTPSGFRVGMPFKTVAAAYPPPRPRFDSKTNQYIYDYGAERAAMLHMDFVVDRKGIIKEISISTGE